MIIKNINLEQLSRTDFINFIFLIIYAFKLDYQNFSEIEKDSIKNMIDKGIYERNEKI